MTELAGKRILFLAAASSPHTRRWAAHMLAGGNEVLIASIHEPDPSVEAVTVRLQPRAGYYSPLAPLNLVRTLRILRATTRRFRPDLTIAYYATSYGLLGALARVPRLVVATAGGDVLNHAYLSARARFRKWAILRFVLPRAETVLAWSPHVTAQLVHRGVPRERVLEQVRGIDVERFRRVADERPAAATPCILSTRLLKPLYDVPTLVRALGRLAADGTPFRAVIAGDGTERARIESMVDDLGLRDRVHLTGLLGEEEILGALREADIYVSTSSSDGASASLFEAMSMRLYPIVTDIPANRPWIEAGVNGALFPLGDATALADRLRAAIVDPALRFRAAEQNAKIVRERLDASKNLQRIEDYLFRT